MEIEREVKTTLFAQPLESRFLEVRCHRRPLFSLFEQCSGILSVVIEFRNLLQCVGDCQDGRSRVGVPRY